MSTATAEKRLVSAPSSTITYVARREDLKLVLKPERDRRNAEGDVVERIPGMRLRFDNGLLRVPPNGVVYGEKREAMDAAEVLQALEGDGTAAHPAHHLLGDREEGFWRLEEPAPAPSEQEISALTDLAIRRDEKGLQRLISEEEHGWARPELLANARSLLERVQAAGEPAAGEKQTAQSKAAVKEA